MALRNRRDTNHEQARSLMREHGAESLVTSNHVVGETWTFLRRRAGHAAATEFLDAVERARRLTIILAGRDVEAAAMSWLRRHDEREYSFVDATSFALMESRRLRSALAFDGDFSAAGFLELRSS